MNEQAASIYTQEKGLQSPWERRLRQYTWEDDSILVLEYRALPLLLPRIKSNPYPNDWQSSRGPHARQTLRDHVRGQMSLMGTAYHGHDRRLARGDEVQQTRVYGGERGDLSHDAVPLGGVVEAGHDEEGGEALRGQQAVEALDGRGQELAPLGLAKLEVQVHHPLSGDGHDQRLGDPRVGHPRVELGVQQGPRLSPRQQVAGDAVQLVLAPHGVLVEVLLQLDGSLGHGEEFAVGIQRYADP